MPEYQFRKMNQDLIEKDLLKQQATATVLEDHPNPVKVFLLGVLTGVSTVLLVEKFGGK